MMMAMIRTIFEVWITSVIMLMGEKPSGRINGVEGKETEEQDREESDLHRRMLLSKLMRKTLL